MSNICTISKVKNKAKNIIEKNKELYSYLSTENIFNENKDKLKKDIIKKYINEISQNNETIKSNTVNNFNPKKIPNIHLNTPNNYKMKTTQTDNNNNFNNNFIKSEKKTKTIICRKC